MKLLKTVTLLLLVLALGFVSCKKNDDNSLDEYWLSIATANDLGDGRYSLTLDNGKKLWIGAPIGNLPQLKYKRVIANYTILSDSMSGYDHYVRLNLIRNILTKEPIYIDPTNTSKQDSIGNNPIKIISVWEGGGYLNFRFEYNAGGVQSHMLNLVSDQADLGISNDTIKLAFRHNQNNDPKNYPVSGYVSFDLAPYKTTTQDSITFEVSSLNFNGETKKYMIGYKINKATKIADKMPFNIEQNTNQEYY